MSALVSANRAPTTPDFALVTLDGDGGLVFHVDPDPLVMREQILALKDQMLATPGEHLEMQVEHTVCDGMYMRKLLIPKGSLLVGKIHKKACMNIVSAGDITVLTESGCMRVRAGYTTESPAGLMKVGYAHEDTIFINVFRTNETDIEKIENEIACESFEALAASIEFKETLCL